MSQFGCDLTWFRIFHNNTSFFLWKYLKLSFDVCLFCQFPDLIFRPLLILFPLQFTEEKLGSAEKTELDAHFENLLQRADKTKAWTEKILKQTESVLQPNPSKSAALLLACVLSNTTLWCPWVQISIKSSKNNASF